LPSNVSAAFSAAARNIVGDAFVRDDPESLEAYGADALKRGRPADLVILPGSTREIASVVALCQSHKVPFLARGGGTGYTGGAVPVRGGVVLSLERLNQILEIDPINLLARVQPNVVTGDLQRAVEREGLFYPPDPASLAHCVIGGNVAENAGGPRAFKYGTTRRYVLGLEAVLPTGEVVRTGSKAVKNVVGYDLTHLLIGSEGTLAILTEITLRLIPKPQARVALRALFGGVRPAVAAVTAFIRAGVVPAAIELVDEESLAALAGYLGRPLAPPGTGAALIIEVDGSPETVASECHLVEACCRTAGAHEIVRAADESDRTSLWEVRRELSASLRFISPIKLNNDVVVPRGRVPELFDLVDRLRTTGPFRIACFGHAGDGNIHVNILVDPTAPEGLRAAEQAVRTLFEGVVALEGSISGEHGIGISKAPYLAIELSSDEIALMKRIKTAFDPQGLLNPGKIFPEDP
jgi:glycolate oxidase